MLARVHTIHRINKPIRSDLWYHCVLYNIFGIKPTLPKLIQTK